MYTNRSLSRVVWALVASFALCLSSGSKADVILFSEDFQSTAEYQLPTGWSGRVNPSGSYPGVYELSGAKMLELPDMYEVNLEPQVSTPSIDFSPYIGQTVTLSFDLYFSPHEWSFSPDTSLIVGLTPSNDRPFGISYWVGGQGVGAPAENEIWAPRETWTHITIDLTDALIAHPDTDGIGMKLWAARGELAVARVDNFVITAVPEPSTFLLMSGVGLLMWLRRRARV